MAIQTRRAPLEGAKEREGQDFREEEEGNGERPAGLYDPDQEEDVANCQEILRVCTLFLYQRLFFFTHNVYAHKGILFIFIKVNSQS